MTDETQQYVSTEIRPNPQIVGLLANITQMSQVENPDSTVGYLLYLTTKEVLRSDKFKIPPSELVPVCFAYYVETYPYLCLEGEVSTEKVFGLRGEAALTLVDNYVETPKVLTVRSLAAYSIKAIREIMVDRISRLEDFDLKIALNRLSHLALITDTVKEYMSGTRREQNLPYIKWLRTILSQAFADPTLELLDTDPGVKSVVAQLMTRAKVIDVPAISN